LATLHAGTLASYDEVIQALNNLICAVFFKGSLKIAYFKDITYYHSN
jgi:hypothetical protein